MARAPAVAMDFIGLSKMPRDSSNGTSPEDHRGRFLEPPLSMPMFQAAGFWAAAENMPGNLGNLSATHERNVQTEGGQNVAPKSKDVACSSGKYEEGRTSSKPSVSVEKIRLDKPLEELSEEDIMQLTREDCRRYLKEKGMRRPSWNKSQAIQQVLSLKGLFDNRCDDDRKVTRMNSQKTSATGSSSVNVEPSKLKQVVQSQGQPSTSPQMQQVSALQRLQESTYEQDAVSNRLKHMSPLIGQQSLPYILQQPSLHRQQSSHSYSVTQERVEEPRSTLIRVLDRHGSNDMQQTRQFEHTAHAPLNNLVGADANGASLVATQAMGRGSSVLSSPGFSIGLPAYVCSLDNTLPIAIQQHVGNRMRSTQTTCSKYVQPVGAGTSATEKQPAAQLTIFYSGTVNVYDDVPVDKARAIMLLAASGDTSKPSSRTKASVDATISAPTNVSSVLATPYKHTPLRPASLPEHPPSRKASLQRFLEKRKDRGRIRSPYLTSRKMVSLNDRVGPAPLPCPALGQTQAQSSGSETSSPTRPPRTPLQTSSNEHGTSPGRRPIEVHGSGVDEKRLASETEMSSQSQ